MTTPPAVIAAMPWIHKHALEVDTSDGSSFVAYNVREGNIPVWLDVRCGRFVWFDKDGDLHRIKGWSCK